MWSERGGLYYVRARSYDVGTGRFLSRDPYRGDRREPTTFPPYAFANSNPLSYTDPTGEISGTAESGAVVSILAILNTVAVQSFRLVAAAAIACVVTAVGTEVADSVLGIDSEGPCDPPGPGWYVRFGDGPETVAELQHDANRTVAIGWPFGVSVRYKPRISGRSDRALRRARANVVHGLFSIYKTGTSPNHYTLGLPNPVNLAAAALFNATFIVRP